MGTWTSLSSSPSCWAKPPLVIEAVSTVPFSREIAARLPTAWSVEVNGDRKRADRDVLLGEDHTGTDRARGNEHLLPVFGAGTQHAEGDQDRGSQAEGHHQVAMAPQQE